MLRIASLRIEEYFDLLIHDFSPHALLTIIQWRLTNVCCIAVFFVQVDSNYSMISIDLIDINLDTFTLLESMPVSQFDALR